MGVPVSLNGVSIGVALIDQGASRSVMRLTAYKQFVQAHGQGAPPLTRTSHMCVMGSTGDKLPVVGDFTVDLAYDTFSDRPNTLIARTPIYVVRDTDALDIICNLIIGRSTLATSTYSCIDTRGHGSLMNPEDPTRDVLPCTPCMFRKGLHGRQQLVTAAASAPAHDTSAEPDESHTEDTHEHVNICATS